MDINIYPVEVNILLKPVGVPRCRIRIGDQHRELTIDQESWVTFNIQGCGTVLLEIEHYGKAELDSATALIIEEIKFNGISSPKFVYQGIYYPTYPKHLLDSDSVVPHQTYLSWNGTWRLEFTLPIYTWIHKTLDLGWVYD